MGFFDRLRGDRQVASEEERVGGGPGARLLGDQLQIPIYDVERVGYPQRMREYDERRRADRRRAEEG